MPFSLPALPMPSPELIEALGLALLHFLWQGLALAGLYRLSLWALREADANLRYLVGVVTLALMALMVPITAAWLMSAPAPATPASTAPASLLLAVAAAPGDSAPALWSAVVAFWLAGVTVLSARTLVDWTQLRRLRARADRAAADWLRPTLAALGRRMGIARDVEIGLVEGLPGPAVVGWLRPALLLPPALVLRLSGEQLEMILAHELAHLRRLDHWVNLFQLVVETALFYHPAVGWVSRQVRIERENACDDLAIGATGKRLAYVEMLAGLEQSRPSRAALALGVGDGQIVTRIRRLVRGAEPRAQRGVALPLALGTALVLALAVGGGALLVPDGDPAAPAAATAVTPSVAVPSTPSSTSTAGEVVADTATVVPVGATEDARATPATRSGPVAVPTAEAAVSTPTPQPEERTSRRLARTSMPLVERTAAAHLELPRSDAPMLAFTPDEALAYVPGPSLPSLPEPPASDPAPAAGDAVAAAAAVLTGGELVRRVEPTFPRAALRRLVHGKVRLELDVGRDGRVRGATVIEESPDNQGFAEAAREAARGWRFESFERAGEPVAHRVRVEFDFDPAASCRATTGTRLPRC